LPDRRKQEVAFLDKLSSGGMSPPGEKLPEMPVSDNPDDYLPPTVREMLKR